jgi:hypothetical protein
LYLRKYDEGLAGLFYEIFSARCIFFFANCFLPAFAGRDAFAMTYGTMSVTRAPPPPAAPVERFSPPFAIAQGALARGHHTRFFLQA